MHSRRPGMTSVLREKREIIDLRMKHIVTETQYFPVEILGRKNRDAEIYFRIPICIRVIHC